MDIPEQDRLLRELRDDVRSIKQTQREVITPKLEKHESDIEKLKSRFVYALTIIGVSVTTALGLAAKGVLR